jgi:putative ABC transport system permease protein
VPISFRYLDWPQGQAQTVVLLEAIDARTYYAANHQRGNPVPGLDLYRRLGEEPATALISENFALLHHVGVGDFLTLPGTETAHRLQVIGILEDYAFPRGVIFIHRDHCLGDFNIRFIDIFDVYLPHPEQTEDARDALEKSSLAAEHVLITVTGEEVREDTSRLIRRLYGLAFSQQIVVGLVATLGVVTALLISVLQRRRELGLLRAVGATRAQVLSSVLAEALLMGLIGSVLGIIFGLVLEWYTLRILFLEECGYRFPLSLPWWEAGLIALLAIVAATLAGLLPAFQALRLHIAESLHYE